MRATALIGAMCAAALLVGAGLEVNGDFENGDALGWTEWGSPWGGPFTYDYAWTDDAYEGEYSLYMSASAGSFGVYQEFCVEPGVAFSLSWAWKGFAGGVNGWWEVLIIDGPFTYDAADLDAGPSLIAKWEFGFPDPVWPAPSEMWLEEEPFEISPTSDVVAVVLKCGANPGPVEVWFDAVTVTHESTILEVTGVDPPKGSAAGGELLTVLGRTA